jgi:hypothetical protein
MKANAMLRGSSAGLLSSQGPNAVIRVDTTVSFLADRQQTIDVAPLGQASNLGYVWKRIFSRRGGARA